MDYFSDIEFINGSSHKGYHCFLSRPKSEGLHSLEFINGGSMFLEVDGKERVVLNRPSVFWRHAGHCYVYGPGSPTGWDHHWLQMKGERPRKMLENCLMRLFPSGFTELRNPETFDNEFHRLLAFAFSPDGRRHNEAVATLEVLVAMISSQTKHSNASSDNFKKILESIAGNSMKNWDFKELAEKEGLSYGHFRRLFKEFSSRSPHEFLLLCRMRDAAKKLSAPDYQVKTIAAEAGYSETSQFSRIFKAFMGLSPKSYRDSLPKYLSAVPRGRR